MNAYFLYFVYKKENRELKSTNMCQLLWFLPYGVPFYTHDILRGKHQYPHFTNEKTEIWRD